MLAKGIGERLLEVECSLTGKFILLVYPDIHISTKEAFSNIIPKKPIKPIEHIVSKQDISEWKTELKNDFEETVFELYPLLRELKNQLYESGALYASMSGSGSCMYGIFNENPLIDFLPNYKTWSGIL